MKGGEKKMKIFGIISLSLVGILVLSGLLWGLGIALGIISLAPHIVSNKVQLNHDVIDRTINADTCLQMQDWFRTQEGTIQTLQQTIENAQTALDQFNQKFPDASKWTDAQNQQYSMLNDNLAGAKNEANDAVNTYDAKAKQENLAYCKSGLPLFIHSF
jgi:hypothetical protein